MKPRHLLIAGSLVANIVFAMLVWRSPDTSGMSATAQTGTQNRRVGSHSDGPPTTPDASASHSADGGNDWADIRSDDLQIVAARLRAAGFPPQTVRMIIATLVDQHHRQDHDALFYGGDETPFWRPPHNPFEDPERRKAINQLNRARDTQLKQLLGDDYFLHEDQALESYRRAWGDLSTDTFVRAKDLFDRYSARQVEISSLIPEPDSDARREKLIALEQQRRADLEKILTPQELENYDLRNSPTANQVRFALQWFDATEDEYRALYRLLKPFETPLAQRYRDPTPEETAVRRQIDEQLQRQIKGMLGEERYADYLQSKAPDQMQLNRLVSRLELPLSAARAVVAVQQDTTARAAVVREDPTLAPEERGAQLAALAATAAAKISATLSPRGLEAYRNYSGAWLQSLGAATGSASPRP